MSIGLLPIVSAFAWAFLAVGIYRRFGRARLCIVALGLILAVALYTYLLLWLPLPVPFGRTTAVGWDLGVVPLGLGLSTAAILGWEALRVPLAPTGVGAGAICAWFFLGGLYII